MAKVRKPRPSFASPSPAPDTAPAAGWVYRSDAPSSPAAPAPAAAAAESAPAAGRRRRWLDAATLPFTLTIVAALQPVAWIRRKTTASVLLLACLVWPAAASAQTPGAVSTQIGTVTEQVIMRPAVPWAVEFGASGDMTRGSTDTTNFGGSGLWQRDWAKWRMVTTGGAGLQRTGDTTHVERYSMDIAFARTLTDKFRLVLLNDWARSPFEGLDHQNATGGVLVWLPDSPKKLGLGVFGGMAYAFEAYTLPIPDQHFATSLAGASATYFFTEQNTLGALLLHSLDLSDPGNYRMGLRVSLQSRVAGGVGLQATYEYSYDHEPVATIEDRHQTLSLGVNLRLAPHPAKPRQ